VVVQDLEVDSDDMAPEPDVEELFEEGIGAQALHWTKR
jgi:hypothetical protein